MKYILGVLVMALLLPVAALGQTVGATTGAINGRVVDTFRRRAAGRHGHDLGAADAGRPDCHHQ